MPPTRAATTLGVVLALAAGPATAAEFSLTAWEREGSEVFSLYVENFVELAEQFSDGEVEVTPYGAGVIAGVFDGHKAVSDELADMAFGWAGYIVNQHAGNAFFGALPGGMGPEALYHWTYDGGGKEMLAEFRRDTLDQHAVACGILGSEVFAHSHRRIQSLADFEGLKHRTAGAFAEVIRALGATPSVIPGPDVFSVLERQAIDSAEYLTPYLNSKIGFQDVAEYVIVPGIHTPAAVYEVTMRTETWEGLSDRGRRAIELARDDDLRARRQRSFDRLHQGLVGQGWTVWGESPAPMLAVIVESAETAVSLSAALAERGVVVPAIRPPTVPRDACRLRLAPTAAMDDAAIDRALGVFASVRG
jgi:TRAP-type mannitol/chloroaromatic compound transport system substrate-binding protein